MMLDLLMWSIFAVVIGAAIVLAFVDRARKRRR